MNNIFQKGSQWEASRVADLEAGRRNAWYVAGAFGVAFLATAIALATLGPARKTVPYLVKQDSVTGNVEVLQPFDNRAVGRQELLNKYWAKKYVTEREQYNYWLVGADYESISVLTEPSIFKDYAAQYQGEKSLDKVFGAFTERRIKVLSVAPSPAMPDQMVIRFERTTVSKGVVVETPTNFTVNMRFRYTPKQFGAEADLMRNPMGFEVFAYRRDVEQQATEVPVTQETSASGAIQ